ncbi:2-Hydroxyacid oxidase 1 [Petromyzon marinus]|nr:hydroxyacid oxidase 1 isoform X2 [Petromyzon marinus]
MSLPAPVCLDDFEEAARAKLPRAVYDYYRSGADGEVTLRDNVAAFSRWRLRPRVLRGVTTVDTRVSVLGRSLSFPVAVAPTAMQRMAHPDGELATARACAALGTGMQLSSWATASVEEVAAAVPSSGAPPPVRWLQLYVYRDRDATEALVRRAEREGYGAIFLTVDTPRPGRRLADERNRFSMPDHLRLANFTSPELSELDKQSGGGGSGLATYVTRAIEPGLSWEHVSWLRSLTALPVVLKGILTAEDAKEAVRHGVNGIVVSNHGARQLDGVAATLDALPEVVAAVGGQVEVYLDGGVRRGTDVLKALALGARAVFVGRPVVWGLAYNGEEGVKKVLTMIREEFLLAMALAGCHCITDINSSLLMREVACAARL